MRLRSPKRGLHSISIWLRKGLFGDKTFFTQYTFSQEGPTVDQTVVYTYISVKYKITHYMTLLQEIRMVAWLAAAIPVNAMNRFHCPCHCETTMQPQQQTQKQMSMAAHLQEPRWPGFGFRGLNHLLHKNLQWGTNQRQHQKYKTTMHKFASVHHRGTALSHTLTPSGIGHNPTVGWDKNTP